MIWRLDMAKGQNAEKNGHLGVEFWSRRCHKANCTAGRYAKRVTHRYERRQAAIQIANELRLEGART